MRKHGPDFKKAVPEVKGCRPCRGQGVTEGVFFQLDCEACGGTGWVGADGAAVEAVTLVRALGARLRKAEEQLALRARGQQMEQEDNRRGAGGSHYTGD